MVNMREEGIIDYNPNISLITPALIGHTYCINSENFSCSVAFKVLQHQTAVKSGEETDSGCWLLSSTRVAARSTWEVPYEPACFFFLLAVTAVAVTIPCHHWEEAWDSCSPEQPQPNTHTHTHTHIQPNFSGIQALGPLVIGLSHSSSQQQAMAHSCLATMAVKKWHNKKQHKQTSQRTAILRGQQTRR